jgi:hypothetical protein
MSNENEANDRRTQLAARAELSYDIAMERSHVALIVLACGVRYGRDGLDRFFPHELHDLLAQTFAELHKNNLPEERLIFALMKMFEHRGSDLPDTMEIPDNVTIEETRAAIRKNNHYVSDSRIEEIDDFRHESVLKDFVYYLSRLFFFRPQILDRIVRSIKSN